MFPFGRVIIACWIVFWLYWLASAFSSKKSSTPNVKRFIRIRIIILVLAVIFYRILNKQTYSFENRYLVTGNETVYIIGFIIFVMGLLLAVWARIYLGKNWGVPMSEKQEPELVTSGPYNYIRHPIYSGILLAFLGSSITGSIYLFPAFAITAVYFIYSAKTEEKLMMKQFPKVYPSYKRKSKMLIPFVF